MRPDRTSPTRPRRRPSGDRGDVIMTWLTKVLVLMTLLGLMGFDAISLGSAHFTSADRATQAAATAAETFQTGKDLQAAYEAALGVAIPAGDLIDPATFSISPEGVVSLTLTHEAPTLLVEKIPALQDIARLEVDGTARPVR